MKNKTYRVASNQASILVGEDFSSSFDLPTFIADYEKAVFGISETCLPKLGGQIEELSESYVNL